MFNGAYFVKKTTKFTVMKRQLRQLVYILFLFLNINFSLFAQVYVPEKIAYNILANEAWASRSKANITKFKYFKKW